MKIVKLVRGEKYELTKIKNIKIYIEKLLKTNGRLNKRK